MKINALQIKCVALNYLAFQLMKVVTSQEICAQLNNLCAYTLMLRERSIIMDGQENSLVRPETLCNLPKIVFRHKNTSIFYPSPTFSWKIF
jgi:hypothetical protein